MKGLSFRRFRACGCGSASSLSLRGVFVFAGLWLIASVSLLPAQTTPPQFKPPVNLGPKINSPFYESDPFWDGPRKKLYFVRDGIYVSEWTDTGWTNAVKLGPQINVGASLTQSPSVSPDGQKLYLTVGAASWDVFVSTWNSSNNDWGLAVNLGLPVNTSGVEFSAHISPDGQRLYFYSLTSTPDSLNPNGRCGFYVSEWNGSTWSVPVSVAAILQHCSNGSQYPSITADGHWLYYDRYVSDGVSIFVSFWNGVNWDPATDLRPQLGGRAGNPSIVPSGDSLFFTGSPDLGGGDNNDIWLAERVVSQRVPSTGKEFLFLLILLLILVGVYLLKFRFH